MKVKKMIKVAGGHLDILIIITDGPLPAVLQEVSLPIINNTECEAMYEKAGFREHIPHIFICAGYREGGKDSCEVTRLCSDLSGRQRNSSLDCPQLYLDSEPLTFPSLTNQLDVIATSLSIPPPCPALWSPSPDRPTDTRKTTMMMIALRETAEDRCPCTGTTVATCCLESSPGALAVLRGTSPGSTPGSQSLETGSIRFSSTS